MKFTIKKLPKSKIELTIEVSTKELESFEKTAILNLGKEIKLEGFRPGHIPEDIIEKTIGKEKILAEAAELAIKENYRKAILENKIEPLGQAEIEILKLATGNPLEFKATVSVLPEIGLPDYKKIAASVKKKPVEIAEKEIDDSLLWLQKSRAKFSLKQEPSQKGDFLGIEYNSPQLENGKAFKDNFILGEGHFLPDFEKELENLQNGAEKNFSVKFPKNHSQKDLAGKDVDFKVKVNSVQKMELPEINDEFAKNLGNFENTEALKKSIREGLDVEKENEEKQRVRQEILDKISQNSNFEIPDILIESEKHHVLEDLKARVSQGLQISFEDYLSKIGKSEKELLDSFASQAEKRVRDSLVLREIGKKENISVSEKESAEEINKILMRYPDIKKAEAEIDLANLKAYTEEVIRNEKTFQLLESFIR
ncbi:MAG: trigger factor [Candidatus Pacebacteria bacterium]|nr:trigger factor [Candidatus Paceibacterota bacterium]